MIVLDGFITNREILKKFCDTKVWDEIADTRTTFVESIEDIKNPLFREVSYNIANMFWSKLSWGEFEYWGNVLKQGKEIPWHVDKDEEIEKVISPPIGAVWYGHPCNDTVEGGYLEIKRNHGEIERIQPKYNRLVVFDVATLHRVSPITKGIRCGFSLSVWPENMKTEIRRG